MKQSNSMTRLRNHGIRAGSAGFTLIELLVVLALVVILATLKQFGIPEAGLLLILGIDQFLDMGRSATNVIGNSLAASAVAKFEGELGPARDDAPAAGAPRPAHA